MFMQTISRVRAVSVRAALAIACAAALAAPGIHAQALKSYDSTKKDFWAKPPADWFLGDGTRRRKGLRRRLVRHCPRPWRTCKRTSRR